MQILFQILVAVVALEHIYILWLEMFAWETRAPKVFTSLPPHLLKKRKHWPATRGSTMDF
ncbi:DUF1304 family protein [Chitinophaga sedimenti]|uniref:DUF1304 family protein n=1 Tax=Chitinophaga sedimenti TaxID=2033606 RepID=UPI00249E42DA|nr:DUF1304 family protein [Chitinophaga sedimenti]